MTKVLGTLDRKKAPVTQGEQIRLTEEEYRGNKYLDIRVWFESRTGEYLPTRRGIKILYSQVPEFKKIVENL